MATLGTIQTYQELAASIHYPTFVEIYQDVSLVVSPTLLL